MKYNELSKYKVSCSIAADTDADEKKWIHASDSCNYLLSEHQKELEHLFEGEKEVETETILNHLSNLGYNIYNIEPID